MLLPPSKDNIGVPVYGLYLMIVNNQNPHKNPIGQWSPKSNHQFPLRPFQNYNQTRLHNLLGGGIS